MTQLLLGSVTLCVLGLVVVDMLSMRSPERFGAEDGAGDEGRYRNASRQVWGPRGAPPLVKVAGAIGGLFGMLSFPATLAPVVMTVLALQGRPFGTDGVTSLGGIIVAALSMSAAVKTIRVSRFLVVLHEDTRDVLLRCLAWLLAWNVIVLLLLGLFPWPASPVSTIALAYSLASFAVMTLLAMGMRVALRELPVQETSKGDAA